MRVFILALTALTPLSTAIAFERSPEETRQQRQEIIDDILNKDSAEDVAIDRNNCLAGAMPLIVKRARDSGGVISPGAADRCVAALTRTGRDGGLISPYEKFVEDGNGDTASASDLPSAIGGAVIKLGSNRVSIGNGRAMKVDPAIAFDAGFAAAYLMGERSTHGMPDLPTLKALSETCLDRSQDNLGLCYATGYAHGVRAVLGERVVVD